MRQVFVCVNTLSQPLKLNYKRAQKCVENGIFILARETKEI